MHKGKTYYIYEGANLIHTGTLSDILLFLNIRKSEFYKAYYGKTLLKNKFRIATSDESNSVKYYSDISRLSDDPVAAILEYREDFLEQIPPDDWTYNELLIFFSIMIKSYGTTIYPDRCCSKKMTNKILKDLKKYGYDCQIIDSIYNNKLITKLITEKRSV